MTSARLEQTFAELGTQATPLLYYLESPWIAMRLRSLVPWWFKIAVKLIIKRLPIPYAFWKRVQIFEHGDMEKADYSSRVFLRHFAEATPPQGFTCLELGPGDSLATAILAFSWGAKAVWLVDAGPFANDDVTLYNHFAAQLQSQGLQAPAPQSSIPAMLEACHAQYLTRGLESLRTIPDGSIDFIFSQAVLEHVRLSEFRPTMMELRRIIRPNGIMTHQIDLQDHLSHGLNNLRFPEAFWESTFMASSGFYTNRLRPARLLEIFAESGFSTEIIHSRMWNDLPTPRKRMHPQFQNLPEQELLYRDIFSKSSPI